jgi:RNase H-like protein
VLTIRPQVWRLLRSWLPASRNALHQKDAGIFSRFAQDCVYLDIETTGLSPEADDITLVGVYDGETHNAFIAGDNLKSLPAHLQLVGLPPAVCSGAAPQSAGFCLTSLPLTRHHFSPRPTGSRGEDARWTLVELKSFPRVTSSQRKGDLPSRERPLGGCRPRERVDRRNCCFESPVERDENHGDPPLGSSPPTR